MLAGMPNKQSSVYPYSVRIQSQMRYTVLATDYDETLAHNGRVADTTIQALMELRASGRALVLVTGRHLPDLLNVFSRPDLFDSVVAENGALLYRPAAREEKLLCAPPPTVLLAALRERQVPFTAGRGIIATTEPHHVAVSEAIRKLGLDFQVILNRDSAMVLPSGTDKATGLKAALDQLGFSPHHVVGIGDAENDHVFLAACGCGIAVANALPALIEHADLVTQQENGKGVEEVIHRLINDDLADSFSPHPQDAPNLWRGRGARSEL